MPKYLVEVKYTLEGIKGVKAEGVPPGWRPPRPPSRSRAARSRPSTSPSARNDAYVLVDMPDNASAAAVGLIVSRGGRGHDPHRRAPHRGRDGRRSEAQDALPGAGGLSPATVAPLFSGPRRRRSRARG